MAKISEKALDLIRREAALIAQPLGLIIKKVEYVREDGLWYLRVTVDHETGDPGRKPAPVTLEDCTQVHRPLSKRLDELDPIKGTYYLEISSPGSDVSPDPCEENAGTELN
ncbi:MAG: ribosome maturation factor RimP [Candidatus Bruticola sp.]